jgi:hypothetical protein
MLSAPSAAPDPIAEAAAAVTRAQPASVTAEQIVEPLAEAVATADTATATAAEPLAEPAPSEAVPSSASQAAAYTPPMAAEPQAVTAIAPPSAAEVEPVAASSSEAFVGAASSPVSAYEATVMGIAEINAKAVGALHANSVATLAFFETLMGARSLSEAIRLQTEHARKQFEAVSGQTKELTALARRVVQEAASGRKR